MASRQARKDFFLKKEAKTFYKYVYDSNDKSFLFLCFKKEILPSLLPSRAPENHHPGGR